MGLNTTGIKPSSRRSHCPLPNPLLPLSVKTVASQGGSNVPFGSTFKMRGVVMRYYLCPLACKFW